MSTQILRFARHEARSETVISQSHDAASHLDFEKLIKTNQQMVEQLDAYPFFVRPIVTNCAHLLAGGTEQAEAAISFLVTTSKHCCPDSKAERSIALLYTMATRKILSTERRLSIHLDTSRQAIPRSPLEKESKQGYMAELRAAKRSVRMISIVPSLCSRNEGAS